MEQSTPIKRKHPEWWVVSGAPSVSVWLWQAPSLQLTASPPQTATWMSLRPFRLHRIQSRVPLSLSRNLLWPLSHNITNLHQEPKPETWERAERLPYTSRTSTGHTKSWWLTSLLSTGHGSWTTSSSVPAPSSSNTSSTRQAEWSRAARLKDPERPLLPRPSKRCWGQRGDKRPSPSINQPGRPRWRQTGAPRCRYSVTALDADNTHSASRGLGKLRPFLWSTPFRNAASNRRCHTTDLPPAR